MSYDPITAYFACCECGAVYANEFPRHGCQMVVLGPNGSVHCASPLYRRLEAVGPILSTGDGPVPEIAEDLEPGPEPTLRPVRFREFT